jgi:tripartite-type tricarboxylate transporter receptor subunit TctC
MNTLRLPLLDRRLFIPICIALLASGPLAAQTYPNRPIRVVVPWPSGGALDLTTRLWAPPLSEALGQQVVVDNRPGASSTIGLDTVAKSKPDGYTACISNIAYGANPSLIGKMPFDSEKDLIPVSLTVLIPLVLSVHPSMPVRSVKQLIALAKAKPGQIDYASAGNASASHLVTELFIDATGAKMVHVPYKGGGPQVVGVVGGETMVMFAPIPNSLQHIRSGRIVPLALSTLKRDPTLPDVPTIAEAIGAPDFSVSEWQGVMGPAGTPSAVVTKLSQDIVKVVRRPDVRERLSQAGAQSVGSSPDELAAFIKREFARWSRVIKSVGIKVE